MMSMMLMVLALATIPMTQQTAETGASIEQATTMMRNRMMQNDKDGDGRLSKAEFEETAKARGGRAAKMAGRMFGRLDGNRDEFLDTAEVDRMLAARVGRLDANGDGRISRDEGQAARARRSGGAE